MIFSLLISLLLINLIIYLNFNYISNFFNFFDRPDKQLKKHQKPVSLMGGSIVLVNLIIILILSKILDISDILIDENYLVLLLLLSIFFYLIGLFDDLKNLTPKVKLLSIIFFLSIIILLFPEIRIQQIKISFLNKIYFLNFFYSYIFIILCFSLLINAINMFDGINSQVLIFTLMVFLVFIYRGFMPLFFISLSICLFVLTILNLQNRVFLGDNGSYLISGIIGFMFIYQYKTFDKFIYGDQVFVILTIPSIDMLRLFITRVLDKKNPFKGDLNHLHHIVNNFVKNKNLTVVVTSSICFIPIFLLLIGFETYYSLLITILIYFFLLLICKVKFR